MAPYNPFQSVFKAILHAHTEVKRSFKLETGDKGHALTDNESFYLRAFNGQWLAKSQPLATQIQKLFVLLYKAGNMSA